jgi:hypothetical protein
MNRTTLAALLSAAALFPASHVQAQAPNPLVGKWSIEYERGRRMENGETTTIMGKATVTITASGDSLIATIQPEPRPDGSAAPPSTAGGRMGAAGATFVQQQMATINMNGEVREQQITLTWTLQASGDALTGTLQRTMPGMAEPLPPAPVKGTRAGA